MRGSRIEQRRRHPAARAPSRRAAIHPVSQVLDEITAIFADLGFAVAEGPDVEYDDYNFTKLNIPPDHPARQMHDTFYVAQAGRRLAATCCAPTPRPCRCAPC